MKLKLWILKLIVVICIKVDGRIHRKMIKMPREEKKKYQKLIDKSYIVELWAGDWIAYYIGQIYGEQEYGATNEIYKNAVKKKKYLFLETMTEPIQFKLLMKLLIS